MKTKTKITLGIIAFLLLTTVAVLCILQSQGFFFDKSPIYGTFEYKNEDGSIAKVVLTEKTVYCENVDYSGIMINASWYMVKDDLKSSSEKKDITIDEFGELQEKYQKEWDFETAFDDKTSSVDTTQYIEEYNQYYYYVNYPPTNSHGLEICVDLQRKTLTMADMEFEYVGE